MAGKENGLGPQAFVDASAQDGSIDTREAMDTLSRKIQGIADGFRDKDRETEDAYFRKVEGVTGKPGFGHLHESELDSQDREVLDVYKRHYDASLESSAEDRQNFYASVYAIETEVSGLDAKPGRAAGDSHLSVDAVNALGEGYARFLDSATGTKQGTERLQDAQETLRLERERYGISSVISHSLAQGPQDRKSVQALHADVYATVSAQGGESGRLPEWMSGTAREMLDKSGYEKTRAVLERQEKGGEANTPGSFFDKFRTPVKPGTPIHGTDHVADIQIGETVAARKELNAMRDAGALEVKALMPEPAGRESAAMSRRNGVTRVVSGVEASSERPARSMPNVTVQEAPSRADDGLSR